MTFQLADLFDAVATADPGREVLVCGERRLTYRELDERATRLAHLLADAGVGVGNHVGLQLANGTEYVEGMLAAFKLRAVPVNINYRYVDRELRYLYDDAGLVALIVHRAFAPQSAGAVGDHPMRLVLDVDDGTDGDPLPGARDYEQGLAGASGDPVPAGGRSSDDLYLIYTGGTTGLPKGVVWRHEDIFKSAMGGGDLAQTGNYVSGPAELAGRLQDNQIVALAAPPLMHAAAHWLAFHQLFTGGKIVLIPRGRFDAAEVWQTIAGEQVFNIVLVGDAMAKPLLDHLENNPGTKIDSLWVLASSGAPMSAHTKHRLARLLPDRMLVDSLGSSETGVLGAKGGQGGATFELNDWTAVLDASGRRIEPGSDQVGRVARRGHVPLRYHNDPDKSAETFVEVDGERWALTGDEAMVEGDGTVKMLGRGSQCINTGGEKVYPEEVEEPIKALPGVEDALVVGVPDARWGERVVAVVQPGAGRTIELADLQAKLRKHVTGYKVPRDLVLVDTVVRSPAGKADYRWAKRAAEDALAREA